MRLPPRLLRPLRRYGAIALGGIAVVTIVTWVWATAFYNILREDAERAARGWEVYVSRSVESLESLLETGTVSPEARVFFEQARTVGRIFRYKLFDTEGRQRLVSDDLNAIETSAEEFAEHTPEAARVVATGRAYFESGQGDGSDRPLYYSEVYVPLFRDGRAIGTIEVYVDQTESRSVLTGSMREAWLKTLLVLAIGFAAPAGAYAWRSRQLAGAASRLDFAARFDALTGTMNRASFRGHVEAALDQAWQHGHRVAVHFLDLDSFKDINDSHGHAIGDAVLALAADRLRDTIGKAGELARLGGDEFAICQTLFEDDGEAAELAAKVVAALGRPYTVGGSRLSVPGTVGYAVFPSDGDSVAKLLRAADIALFRGKREGRGMAFAFQPSMESERQSRLDLEARLRAALADQEFSLNFQPFFEHGSGRLEGFEVLLRLNDNDGKPIAPEIFIPIAEEIGLIGEIGEWVIREACGVAADWPDHLIVAVNMSPMQFQDERIVDTVAAALKQTRLPAGRLELEVTETILIANTERVLKVLRRLKEVGVSIALDDFGTGYSSLSYLWRFPFDKLKVDKSFMAELGQPGSKTMEVLKTIIALGKVLNMRVAAEGVETEEQSALLKRLACDLVQGFFFGRPMPVADIAATILNNARPDLAGPIEAAPKRRAPRKARARKPATAAVAVAVEPETPEIPDPADPFSVH